jgi:hypothetical protein
MARPLRGLAIFAEPTPENVCYVKFAIRNGRYEVQIDGWRYVVPTETIIDGIASPTGKAVVCYTYSAFGLPLPAGVRRDRPQDTIEILCFVPPRPTS